MKWAQKEELFLEKNYNIMSSKEISKVIKKSKSAVLSKAWKLKLKKDLTQASTKSIRNISDLPEETKQIICGSLLGDATLEKCKKNSSFYEAHCLNQEDYIRWKVEKLSMLNPHLFYRCKNKPMKDIAFHTRTFLVFNEYRNLFYPYGRKRITREILNQLESLGLAVWIMDDGTYSYNGSRINIATNDFSFNEQLLIKEWFQKRYGITPVVYSQNNQFYISFGVRDTKSLIDVVKPFIIPSMRYKIGEDKMKRKDAITKYRNYRKRKDVKERRRLTQVEYRKKPEVKEKMTLYNQRPIVKEKKRIWAQVHRKL